MNTLETELKRQVYKLLIDKVEKASFEKYMYQHVGNDELKTDSMLFNLININYKSDDYKNNVLAVFKDYCSELELLGLEVYEKSKRILELNTLDKIYELVYDLREKNVEFGFEHQILMDFYSIYEYYSLTTEKFMIFSDYELISKAKEISQKVIIKYKFIDDDNWDGLLKD